MLQEVMPGDLVVVRRIEAAVLYRAAHRFVHVKDQSAIEREAGEDREIALRNAEGQITAARIAPLGDDPAASQYEAIRAAAWPNRTKGLVPGRLFLKIVPDGMGEITAPGRLALGGKLCRSGKPCWVPTDGLRSDVLPFGGIGRRNIGHEVVSGRVQA